MDHPKIPRFILRLAAKDKMVDGYVLKTDFIPPVGSRFTVEVPAYEGATNQTKRSCLEVEEIYFDSPLVDTWLTYFAFDQACDVVLTVKEVYR